MAELLKNIKNKKKIYYFYETKVADSAKMITILKLRDKYKEKNNPNRMLKIFRCESFTYRIFKWSI